MRDTSLSAVGGGAAGAATGAAGAASIGAAGAADAVTAARLRGVPRAGVRPEAALEGTALGDASLAVAVTGRLAGGLSTGSTSGTFVFAAVAVGSSGGAA